MSQAPPPSITFTNPKWVTITGWVLTVLIVALLCFSAYTKVSIKFQLPGYQWWEADVGKLPLHTDTIFWIGVVEFACAMVYLLPRTAVLGGALLNGYLGGAVFVHVLQKELVVAPIMIGVIMWLGIYLREPRLRAIMPWRT